MTYLLREFWKFFLISMSALVLLITLGNIFDEMNRVLRHDPPAWAAAAFFLCKVPMTVAQVTPLGVLVATLFTLAAMLKSHELVAMRAAGVGQYAIAAPFLLSSLLITGGAIAFNEIVVPRANHARVKIKRVHFQRQSGDLKRIGWRVALWTRGGWGEPEKLLVYAEEANEDAGLLRNVTIVAFRGRTPVARYDAVTARPVAGAWKLNDVQVYRWKRDGLSLYRHRQAEFPIAETIEDFLRETKPVDAQTMSDLNQSIERRKKTGREYSREEVFYHLKWAFPFANVIVALLGLGISFMFQTNPREGQAKAIGAAALAAFAYIGLEQLGQTLGVGGVLAPLPAMWMANVVFLVIGGVLVWRAWRF